MRDYNGCLKSPVDKRDCKIRSYPDILPRRGNCHAPSKYRCRERDCQRPI